MTEPISQASAVAAPVVQTYSPTLPEPYTRGLIFIGSLLFLYYGVEAILTGVVFLRGGPGYRDRHPTRFWMAVWVLFFVSGGLLIWALCRIYFGPTGMS
jgi:hypothetical protein